VLKVPPIAEPETVSNSIEQVDAIGFVCGLLSVFFGEAVLPTPLAKLLHKNVEKGIYTDISGYIRIESTLIGIYSHKIVLFILTTGNPGSPSAS
jgi:hypothetical protein